MLNDINQLVKTLNKKSTLPAQALRRNHAYYKFVSFINHSIALFFSENFHDTALFIRRADVEMQSLTANGDIQESDISYFELCSNYLRHMSRYLIDNKLIAEDYIEEFIPDKYR